jgi:Co/Zn/Cd efflux system component
MLIILRSAWRLADEARIFLLEGAPAGLDRREIARHEWSPPRPM